MYVPVPPSLCSGFSHAAGRGPRCWSEFLIWASQSHELEWAIKDTPRRERNGWELSELQQGFNANTLAVLSHQHRLMELQFFNLWRCECAMKLWCGPTLVQPKTQDSVRIKRTKWWTTVKGIVGEHNLNARALPYIDGWARILVLCLFCIFLWCRWFGSFGRVQSVNQSTFII